jgi:predicted nucleic acid-binding protein
MAEEGRVSLDGPILDTNVVLRFLRKDEVQHAAARTLFEQAAASGQRLVLLDVVVAEIIFVLRSFYKCTRSEAAESMLGLLDHQAVGTATPGILRDALARYAATNLHFVDCYLAAMGKAADREVCTFDQGLAKFGDVRVIGGDKGEA